MRTRIRFLLVTLPILAVACAAPVETVDEAPPIDLAAEQSAVKEVVDAWWGMWEAGDLTYFEQAFAQDADMVILGTDAAEYWVGYDAARESLEVQVGVFEDVEGTVRNQDIKVHASGEVAWFTEMIDMGVTSGDERVELTVWFSGVLEKRAGNWLIVQLHASVPVEGQAVEY